MKRIWLQNYRCFRDRQDARLAPLTILVGDNSTGKTSFLAMVRALGDVAYENRVPNFKEEPYDLGSFDEIAHFRGGRGGRATSFESGFEMSWDEAAQAHQWHVVFSRRGTAPVPTKRRLANKEGDVWLKHGESDVQFGTPSRTWKSEISAASLLAEVDRLPPLTLLAFLHGSSKEQRAVEELVESALVSAQRIYAGAPVRSKPRRTYDPARVASDPEGDYIPMFLANRYFEDKHWARLQDALRRFGQDAGLFDEISVRPLGKQSGPFQLQIRRFDGSAKGPQRNLIDVGYGVSQVLPIVTELLRKDTPGMFLLQQPEVHLHPSAQAALGSLFCRVAGWNRQLIVETHSDHLIDRVRMDVRDGAGALKPSDVSILYFERGNLDVRIHSLRIDDEGNVRDAPPGYRQFFMEEVTRSLWQRDLED